MADLSLTAREDEPWVVESPQALVVGEGPIFTITYPWASSLSSAGCNIYKDGTDVTSTNMTGSTSTSGNVQTLKTLQSLVKGRYVLLANVTISSSVVYRKCLLIVQDKGDE